MIGPSAHQGQRSEVPIQALPSGKTLMNIDYHELSFVFALVAMNALVVWALRRISLRIELREVLAEKDPVAVETRTNAIESIIAQRKGLLGTGDTPQPEVPDPLPTSYSRLAGVLGALVLVGVLWALANFVVWASFWDPVRLAPVLDSASDFFLAGAALFAPYAFKQLTGIFRSRA